MPFYVITLILQMYHHKEVKQPALGCVEICSRTGN